MIGTRRWAACLLLALLAACEKGRSPEPKTAVPVAVALPAQRAQLPAL